MFASDVLSVVLFGLFAYVFLFLLLLNAVATVLMSVIVEGHYPQVQNPLLHLRHLCSGLYQQMKTEPGFLVLRLLAQPPDQEMQQLAFMTLFVLAYHHGRPF